MAGTREPNKKDLQKQMERTRESVSDTVGEIKKVVNKQYEAARETVAGVLDYREQFQNEPLVWSLGALSAGFALGYTMGYAHKETKGSRRQSQVAHLANSLVDELSVVGNNLVMPALNSRINDLFGFDFAEVLESIRETNKPRKSRSSKKRVKTSAKRSPTRKTRARTKARK